MPAIHTLTIQQPSIPIVGIVEHTETPVNKKISESILPKSQDQSLPTIFANITMGGYNFISASGILLTLALQTAFASPTPSNVQPDDMIVRRDEYINGLRIAGENEVPPPSVVFPSENDKRDSADRLQPREGAPTMIPSSDGKYQIGTSLCSQGTDITKYFLYSSDLQEHKKAVCDKVFSQIGADGTDLTLVAVGAPPLTGSKLLRAKVKVASTIWHKGSVQVFLTMTNWGMGTDPASKIEATALCQEAIGYVADTCNNAISGTDGSHPPLEFTHEAARGGSVVWNDHNEKKQLEFNIGLKKN